jgi:hypothetical protein
MKQIPGIIMKIAKLYGYISGVLRPVKAQSSPAKTEDDIGLNINTVIHEMLQLFMERLGTFRVHVRVAPLLAGTVCNEADASSSRKSAALLHTAVAVKTSQASIAALL